MGREYVRDSIKKYRPYTGFYEVNIGTTETAKINKDEDGMIWGELQWKVVKHLEFTHGPAGYRATSTRSFCMVLYLSKELTYVRCVGELKVFCVQRVNAMQTNGSIFTGSGILEGPLR
ncbi:hypothetical protein ALPO108162_05745 [Alicyclobacillus pomorum]